MKTLTEQDYIEAAEKLNTEVAIIKAVAEVESAGSGFLKSGAPKILFEAHQFYKRVPVDVSDKTISVKGWTEARKYYKYGNAEYSRLALAMSYDVNSALQSASWGKFQIMGFNFSYAGYDDVFSYVQGMWISEKKHLKAFLNFISAKGIIEPMGNKDWNKFARIYNGSRYKENRYAEKLANAYEKYKGD